jgi:hypothetical protein
MDKNREAFCIAMKEMFGWNNCDDILNNPDNYSEKVHADVFYAHAGFQAALMNREKKNKDVIDSCDITQEHLKRFLHYNPDTGLFTRLTKSNRFKIGEVAGTRNTVGYILVRFDGYRFTAHRLAWLYMTGKLPSLGIDHINGLKDDNRFCNLREADQAMNALNTGANKNNPFGLKGITFSRKLNKFCAKSTVRGISHKIGYFDTKEDAYAAYVEFAKVHHGEFMHHSLAISTINDTISGRE